MVPVGADEMDAVEIEAVRAEMVREGLEELEAERRGEVSTPVVVEPWDGEPLPF